MESISFSHNWNNKLDCKIFTSIRLSDRFKVGDIVEVFLKGKRLNNAKILRVKRMFITDLTDEICLLDTGYDLVETKRILDKMYPQACWATTLLYLVFFKRLGLKNENEIPFL